jgi:hypothetical protein
MQLSCISLPTDGISIGEIVGSWSFRKGFLMNKTVKLLLIAVLFAFAFSFVACSDALPIKLSKKQQFPNAKMEAKWRAPKTFSKNAWIGLVRTKVPAGEAVQSTKEGASFVLLNGKSKGTFKFKAPGAQGEWDVRMYDDENGNEIFSASFLCSNEM